MSVHSPHESITFGNSLLLRVDGAIGAMSLSPNGRDAVLAGRRGLFIIDLDDPFTTPRWLHHITSWEVADVQWSPHHTKPSWCISTSNQKALLWDLSRSSNNAILNVLHHHTRAITDINFHPFDPELLATCSIDTFILSWDMRTPRKPVSQWAEWRAGATQVKWNHKNPYEIASSHDNSFYIWDSRKGALPVVKINKAHNGKINGLDFSNGSSNIITCSNDNSIRFWDLSSSQATSLTNEFNFFDANDVNKRVLDPIVTINCDFPVARARSLPFGSDKACGVMPVRGGQNSIQILNYDAAYKLAKETGEMQTLTADSIYTFKGHNGPIKDFLWRKRHEYYEGFESKQDWKDYQLVTWLSQDVDLKLWPHDEELYEQVNYNPTYHKILDNLVNEELDSEDLTGQNTPTGYREELIKSPNRSQAYDYKTYCIEPAMSINDLAKDNNGDMLSALAKYKLSKNLKQGNLSQLNHLDWISGVRIGHISNDKDANIEEEDGPTNLGEEVSIVGHKFPKIRFEKISVSTGHLVMSLRGPSPSLPTAASTNNTDEGRGSVSTGPAVPNNTSLPNVVVSTTDSVDKDSKKPEATPVSNPASTVGNIDATQNTTTIISSDDVTPEQKLIFIRLEIRFPKNYPYLEQFDNIKSIRKLVKTKKNNSIKFEIEDTHELTPQIKEEMIKNLGEISEFYSNKHNKFCLEPCLRYLLGDKIELSDSLMIESSPESNEEKVLEGDEVIQEVGTEGWADDLINQQPDFDTMQDDSSSGDEDDTDLIPAVGDDVANSTDFTNELTSKDELVVNADVNNVSGDPSVVLFDSTPIPKGCGALWANNGQLVCFFIPKNNDMHNKNSQRFNIFKFSEGGFSLKESSHAHRNDDEELSDSEPESVDRLDNSDSENDSDSESITSSSDDSFTNDWDEILQNDVPSRSRIPGLFKTAVGLGNRFISHNRSSLNRESRGGTTSNYKSSAHGDASNAGKLSKKRSRNESKKSKNIVGIFDFSHLIPDKYDLACEYRVLGDSPENLARYNSLVALKYGLDEISDVWRILEMVLIKDVRLNDINPAFQPAITDKNASALQELLLTSALAKKANLDNGYRFYWGTHPFGHTWLIKEIMKYFELKGNIQMLAMLSCVLFENIWNIKKNSNDIFNIPINTPYQAMPPPPSLMDLKAIPDYTNEVENFGFTYDNKTNTFHESFTSETRPDLKLGYHRDSAFSVDRRDTEITNGIGYSHSIASSFDLHNIKDSSPDRFSSFKKSIQPSNSYITHSGGSTPNEFNLTPRNSKFFKLNTTQNGLSHRRSSVHLNAIPKKSKGLPTKKTSAPLKNRARLPPVVTIDIMNASSLDLFDDSYNSSLLDSQDHEKIRIYREQYAEMLFLWGLPVNRIKVLKFNYPNAEDSKLNPTDDSTSQFIIHKVMFGIRNKNKPLQQPSSLQQLVATPTNISSAKHNSWNSGKRNSLKYCSLCDSIITKRVMVCTNCEHVLHSECAVEWWGAEEATDENDLECPSGCGCKCLGHRI